MASRARERRRRFVVVTFDPHPLKVLHPERAPKMIQTLRQREEAIEACGIDALVLVPFTRDFSLIPAEDFAQELLGRRLAAREVCVGARFVFGRERGGNLEVLRARRRRGAGFSVHGLADVADAAGPSRPRASARRSPRATSTARERAPRPAVRDGRNHRERRPHGAQDRVPDDEPPARQRALSEGRRLLHGREDRVLRADVRCVTNIGRRPTVYEDYTTTIESYILDFSSDVYGERVRLSFFERVREEMTFPSMLELTAQIRLDVEATRLYFQAHPVS